jgi:hypothetical protein
MKRRRWWVVGFAVLFFGVLVTEAHATTIRDTYGPARSDASVGFGFETSFLNFGDSHTTIGGDSSAITSAPTDFPLQASGGAGASLLTGSLSAGVNWNDANGNAQYLPIDAGASARFVNYGTINAPGLTGATGTIQFGAFLHGTIILLDPLAAHPSVTLRIDIPTNENPAQNVFFFQHRIVSPTTGAIVNDTFFTQPATITFGEPFAINGLLVTDITGTAYSTIDYALAQVNDNFTDTAGFTSLLVFDANGNPVTDFTFTTDFGNLFSSPPGPSVPEPGTLAMVISGAIVLALSRRWGFIKHLAR